MNGAALYILPVFSALSCALTVPFAKRLAERAGAIDRPDARRINRTPIPRMGGVAIFASFLLTLAVAFFVASRLGVSAASNLRGAIAFAAGAVSIFVTGVADDIYGLRPRTKLLAEFLAASLVVAIGGCQVTALSSPWGLIELGWFALPLTIFWIVGITNAVNLLDGMDGLASGVVIIALTTIVAMIGLNHASSVIAVILIGSCFGFLVHNFHPATIFMGDSGSLFLGMSLGVLSTYANVKSSTGLVVAVPMLVVALPLADITWAMGRRYTRGLVPTSARSHVSAFARMFVPDKSHIHHRLLNAGYSQREASYVLYGVQALAGVLAIYLALMGPKPPTTVSPDGTAAVSAVRRDPVK